MTNKIGLRKWMTFIIAGLVGQIAWALENMYLNVYVFYTTDNYYFIPLMTALSAVVATLTTLFMGALSDRLGKRKAFISLGYIIWGISIVLFAFFDTKSNISWVGNSFLLSGTFIVILDCLMTFFGSTANDAAFNAYVTDNTLESNRGKVESVLSILPMISMILIVFFAGIFVENKNHEPQWLIFFSILGGITLLAGIALLFVIPKDEIKENKSEPYLQNIIHGFKPSVIKENKLLYLTLIAFLAFNIAIQIFFPYFMVYIQNVLKINGDNFTITLGIVLIVACIITVIIGLFMDKIGKNKIIIPSISVAIIGAIMFFFAKDMVLTIIFGIILMSGYLVSTAIFGAKIRDNTPKGEAGLFQGIRMLFAVLLPMVSGPYIGEALFNINKVEYVNEYYQVVLEPNAYMFLGVAFFLLVSALLIILLMKQEKKALSNNPKPLPQIKDDNE